MAQQFWRDIGPVEVHFDGNEIGDTFQGARWLYNTEVRDSFRDRFGVEPYDSYVAGSIPSAVTNIADCDLEKLVNVIPGSVLSAGPTAKRLTLRSAVGRSLRDNAAELILKPIIDGEATSDETLWFRAPLAHPIPVFEVVADFETQRIYRVDWKIFSNLSTGDQILLGKDQA